MGSSFARDIAIAYFSIFRYHLLWFEACHDQCCLNTGILVSTDTWPRYKPFFVWISVFEYRYPEKKNRINIAIYTKLLT